MADDLEKWAAKIRKLEGSNLMIQRYSILSNKKVDTTFVGVTPYYPKPKAKDYNRGFMYRHFVVRYNGAITEISNKEASRKKGKLPTGLYSYIMIKWRVEDSTTIPKGMSTPSSNTSDVNEFYIRQGSKSLSKNLQKVFREYFYDLEAFKLSS